MDLSNKTNQFDKAKMLARKYSKQCKVLRIIAKTKIKTKVQVDQVNRLVDLVKNK